MGYNVERTDAFEADLDATTRYLIGQLCSVQAAVSLYDAIEEAIVALGETPFIHALSRKPSLHEAACREHPVKNYVIVYRVVGDEVVFLRLFHQTQLYDRLIDMSQEGGLA